MFENEKIVISDILTVLYCINDIDTKRINHSGYDMHSYELLYFISGRSKTAFNDAVFYNNPDTVTYLPKAEGRYRYFVDVYEPGDAICVMFHTNTPLPPNAFNISVKENGKLKKLFCKMQKIWIFKEDGYYAKTMSLLYEIISELQNVTRNKSISNKQWEKIKPGMEYIQENYYNKDFNIDVLPKLCGISYSYFKRLFIAQYNMPPSQYISQLKMKHACELLLSKKYKITQISDTLGYESAFYFSKVFKKEMGCSPSQYMKAIMS